MCFNPLGFLTPKAPAPVLPRMPETPTIDSDAVREREMREAEMLAATGGTYGNVRTDLSASDVRGDRRVLLGV